MNINILLFNTNSGNNCCDYSSQYILRIYRISCTAIIIICIFKLDVQLFVPPRIPKFDTIRTESHFYSYLWARLP